MSQDSYLREFCAQVSKFVFLAVFDRFTACWNCMSKKNHKTDISASSMHEYDKSCS